MRSGVAVLTAASLVAVGSVRPRLAGYAGMGLGELAGARLGAVLLLIWGSPLGSGVGLCVGSWVDGVAAPSVGAEGAVSGDAGESDGDSVEVFGTVGSAKSVPEVCGPAAAARGLSVPCSAFRWVAGADFSSGGELISWAGSAGEAVSMAATVGGF
jgi:hypothetical protein